MINKKIILASTVVALFGFIAAPEIKTCYISFKGTKTLTSDSTSLLRLPKSETKPRMVTTDKGEAKVSNIDGYKVVYNNPKNFPFVDTRVVLSDPEMYKTDSVNVIANLIHENKMTPHMETKDLLRLHFNGYTVFGISRDTIGKQSTLGTYIFFPGNNTIIYANFNNLRPEQRHCETLLEYKKERNQFFADYTRHIKDCPAK